MADIQVHLPDIHQAQKMDLIQVFKFAEDQVHTMADIQVFFYANLQAFEQMDGCLLLLTPQFKEQLAFFDHFQRMVLQLWLWTLQKKMRHPLSFADQMG